MGGGQCTIMESLRRAETGLNRAVAESPIGRYFKLTARKSSFTKELRAGTVTFLTMAYIISVNAAILTDSGGPCTVHDCTPPVNSTSPASPPGPECKFESNPGYERCLAEIRSDLVVATVLTAVIGCFAMGSFANLPLGLAPGMGANAFLTYNMVGYHGSGKVPYGTALSAMMFEGVLFLALSLLGLRGKLARLIPRSIRLSAAAGMGLFLAFTGLQSHQGVGLIGPSKSSLVAIAACTVTDPVTGECVSGVMQSPTFWLGVAGFLLSASCLAREVKGSMIYGLVFVTLVSWIRGTKVTIFPDTSLGNSSYEYFKKVVDFHMIKHTAGQYNFSNFSRSEVWISVFTLLYVDILDTTSSMYSMAEYAGFMDENGSFEGEYRGFITDASITIVSTALGTTTAATYLESTAGIKEGGRTGLTAIFTGLYFVLALFFTPLFTSVPPWAVGPSLVLVGTMMMGMVKDIEWSRMKEAVPAFITMILMPLTFSIANGIVAGIGLYIVLHLYDYVAALVGWARKMTVEPKNQVSAAGVETLLP